MDGLINYLMSEFEGHNDEFTQMDLTTDQFRQIIKTQDMRIDNVERFVYEWRGHHQENKEIPKMWQLVCMRLWDEKYYMSHLYQYFKYGLMDERVCILQTCLKYRDPYGSPLEGTLHVIKSYYGIPRML